MLKNLFLISNQNLPSFGLNLLSLFLSLHAFAKSPSPPCFPGPFRCWKAAVSFPQSLLFSRLNSPNSLCLSSQESYSSPLTVFVALLWTCSNRFISFLCCRPQSWMLYSRWALTQSGLEGQNHLTRPAGYTSLDAAQDMVGFLGCVSTLLGHVELYFNQTLKSFSSGLLSIHSLPSLYLCLELPRPMCLGLHQPIML